MPLPVNSVSCHSAWRSNRARHYANSERPYMRAGEGFSAGTTGGAEPMPALALSTNVPHRACRNQTWFPVYGLTGSSLRRLVDHGSSPTAQLRVRSALLGLTQDQGEAV